jgi:hypothetical protein
MNLDFENGREQISNPKSEISNWTCHVSSSAVAVEVDWVLAFSTGSIPFAIPHPGNSVNF